MNFQRYDRASGLNTVGMKKSVRSTSRDLRIRLRPTARARARTFDAITEPKARKRLLPSARIFDGSRKILTKLSNPIMLNEPMPDQSVNAKNPPTALAA